MPHPSSEPAEPKPALRVRDLAFSHGASPTIVGFKWELAPGALAALYGPSGAGKSTLLALFAGALTPSSGAVDRPGPRRVGFMPQAGGLHLNWTVEENMVAFGSTLGSGAALAEAVNRSLALIGLASRRHEVVERLSAGLQQRVSFAVATLWNPELLLLDEPFTLADDAWARTAWAHLDGLAKRGHTVVVATSRATDALRCAEIALVRGGRLLQAGRTAELAPAGKARVGLRYMAKTGPLAEEVEVDNLATDLPGLMDRKPTMRPIAIDIRPDPADQRLAALLDL